MYMRLHNFFNFVQIFSNCFATCENRAISRETESCLDLLLRKIPKQKVAGIYCRLKSESKKSRVLKVVKSRNIFARQLIPVTFSTRDFSS